MNFSSDTTTVEEKPETQCVDDFQSQTQSEAQQALNTFWPKVLEEIKSIKNVKIFITLELVFKCDILDGFKTTSTTFGQDKKNYET